MNRRRIVWLLAVVIPLAICAVVYAEASHNRIVWSYAVVEGVLDGNGINIKLSSPDQVIEARDWPTFNQKIGASPTPAGRLPEAIMLNAMGSDGWELVAVSKPEDPRRSTRYFFKRPGY